MTFDKDFAAYAHSAWAGLVRSGVVLGCSPEEADDLAQSTLLKVFRHWRKVEGADNRDAYVYRMLLNTHRDTPRRRWRTEKPRAEFADTKPTAGPELQAQVALADAVQRALADLSLVHRQSVVLRYFAHLTEAETAHVLGVAPGTVKSRLSRAMKVLATNTHLLDLTEGTRRGTP